jgi:hypothetical protein
MNKKSEGKSAETKSYSRPATEEEIKRLMPNKKLKEIKKEFEKGMRKVLTLT